MEPVSELPWARPDWRERAERWIGSQLGPLGLAPAGPVQEVKMRPWSAVLRAPTSAGDIYFKANLPALANEPALTRVLARIDPGHVLPVLAEEPDEGWMLQADGGPTMRSRLGGDDDVLRWERMLRRYAQLQVRASAHVTQLLAAGAPDRRLGALPALYERLAEAEGAGPRGLGPRLAELCAELEEFGVPASIDHSDLHAVNVLAPGDDYVFFDWHEAAVSHPFFSMVVALRWVAHEHGMEPGGPDAARLRNAYLDPFTGCGDHASRQAALDLALRVGPLTRALGWMRVVAGLPSPERVEWAEYVTGWLEELKMELERA